jgi:hypothetical protein
MIAETTTSMFMNIHSHSHPVTAWLLATHVPPAPGSVVVH